VRGAGNRPYSIFGYPNGLEQDLMPSRLSTERQPSAHRLRIENRHESVGLPCLVS
jgi:hypothetical protein